MLSASGVYADHGLFLWSFLWGTDPRSRFSSNSRLQPPLPKVYVNTIISFMFDHCSTDFAKNANHV